QGSGLLQGGVDVEGDEVEQLVVLHLGEQQLGAPFEQVPRQDPLRFDQAIDPFLDRAAADELVDQYVSGLPEAEGAGGRLVLARRVPPAIEVDDVRGGGEIETGAPRLERQDEVADRVVLL